MRIKNSVLQHQSPQLLIYLTILQIRDLQSLSHFLLMAMLVQKISTLKGRITGCFNWSSTNFDDF